MNAPVKLPPAVPKAVVVVPCHNEALTIAATVRKVSAQGKGSVVRRMFSDIEAEAYVMVDGDDTYDAGVAPQLVNELFEEGLDMVVGSRSFTDILSGYRIFSRRYVKSFAAHSTGFEIETELTVHALELRMPVAEVLPACGIILDAITKSRIAQKRFAYLAVPLYGTVARGA